jgi:hypothetical protein
LERGISDRLDAVGYCYTRKATLVERIIPDSLNAVRYYTTFEAENKSFSVFCQYAITLALIALVVLRNGYALQVATIYEHPITDSLDGGGYFDTRQGGAIGERVIPDSFK